MDMHLVMQWAIHVGLKIYKKEKVTFSVCVNPCYVKVSFLYPVITYLARLGHALEGAVAFLGLSKYEKNNNA